MTKAFLTAADIAHELGVTSGRIYQLIAQEKIPSVRIGGRIRIPRISWERWEAERVAAADGSFPATEETNARP